MTTTPQLELERLQNELLPRRFNGDTLLRLDVAAPLILEATFQQTPPSSPAIGEAYHVSSGTAGTLWEGLSNTIAYWAGAWRTVPLRTGMRAYVRTAGTRQVYRQIGGNFGWAATSLRTTINFSIPNPTAASFEERFTPIMLTGAQQLEVEQVRAKVYGTVGDSATVGIVTPDPFLRPVWVPVFGQTIVAQGLNVSATASQASELAVVAQPQSNAWLTCIVAATTGAPTLLSLDIVVTSSF